MRRILFSFFIILLLPFCSCGKQAAVSSNTITIACFEGKSQLAKSAAEYKQTHPEIEIEIVEYNRSDKVEEDGLEKIKRDILAGKGPDIIDYGYTFSYTDLYGNYNIDMTDLLDRSGLNLLPNVLKAFSYDGKQVVVPTGIYLDTLAVNSDYSYGANSWNANQLIDYYSKFYEATGGYFYCGAYQQDVLNLLLQGSLNSYINWGTGECYFDSDNFKDLLMFARMFPEEFDFSENESLTNVYREGRGMVYPGSLIALEYIACSDILFPEGKVQYIGYPTEKGSSAAIRATNHVFSITQNCKNQQQAFDFISYFLSEDYQYEIAHSYNIPVNVDAINRVLAEYQNVQYGSDGNPVELVSVGLGGNDRLSVYNLTPEQCNHVMEIITSADFCSNQNAVILNILFEEAEAFFNGEKSAEAVCEIINRRVSLYVNERMGGNYTSTNTNNNTSSDGSQNEGVKNESGSEASVIKPAENNNGHGETNLIDSSIAADFDAVEFIRLNDYFEICRKKNLAAVESFDYLRGIEGDAEYIYYADKYAIYRIKHTATEPDSEEMYRVDDGYFIFAFTRDCFNNFYIVVSKDTYDKYIIRWNPNGDTKEYENDGTLPYSLTATEDGRLFVSYRDGSDNKLFSVFDNNGSLVGATLTEEKCSQITNKVSLTPAGDICKFAQNTLYLIDGKTYEIKKSFDVPPTSAKAVYCIDDTKCVIYSVNGYYLLNLENGECECILSKSECKEAFSEGVKFGIMPNGIVVLMDYDGNLIYLRIIMKM